jgi:hypothetical protein
MKLAYQKHPFTIALALIAAANCILFLYFVEKASVRVPVLDLLDWLQFYGERCKDGDWLGYLWTPHNEHRMVFMRMLLALDVKWFGDQGETFAASGFIILLGMAVAICWKILKSDLSISWKLTAIPIAVLVLTPVNTVIMIGMQANGEYLQVCSFGVFALVLFDGATEQDDFSKYRRTAAIVCACLAAFGLSGGLLIWPALMWSAWKGSLRWGWIAGIACVGISFIAVYLWNLPLPGDYNLVEVGNGAYKAVRADSPVSRSMDFSHIVRSFDFVIRFLGLPWSHVHQLAWPARVIGLSILSLGSFALISVSLSVRVNALKRLGAALILFSFLIAGAAAWARVDLYVNREMTITYGMFVVLAHLGLLVWSLDLLERLWNGAHRRSFQWLLLGTSLAWFGQQIVVGHFAAEEANRYNDAWSRFVAGDWTADMLRYVYPDRDRAEAGLAYLRANGLLLKTTN